MAHRTSAGHALSQVDVIHVFPLSQVGGTSNTSLVIHRQEQAQRAERALPDGTIPAWLHWAWLLSHVPATGRRPPPTVIRSVWGVAQGCEQVFVARVAQLLQKEKAGEGVTSPPPQL